MTIIQKKFLKKSLRYNSKRKKKFNFCIPDVFSKERK